MSKHSLLVVDTTNISILDMLKLEEMLKDKNLNSIEYLYDTQAVVLCDEELEDVHTAVSHLADEAESYEKDYLKSSDRYDPTHEEDTYLSLMEQAKEWGDKKDRYEVMMAYLEPIIFW